MRPFLFILSLLAMGISFLNSPFRKDERWFFAGKFGLDSQRYVPGEDSMAQAWASIKARPSFHNLKNISHEWAKESPKRAVKFLSFVILILLIVGAL